MQLNNFVAAYVEKGFQSIRDYTGAKGWVHIGNMVLRNWVNRGYITYSNVKEVGIEVSRGFWINIPSDCSEIQKISFPISGDGTDDPENYDKTYRWEIVNGKIKLAEWFDKKASPDAFTLSSWLTTGVSINDADATADLWNNYLLVVTNGDVSGQSMLIATTAVAAGGKSALTFELPLASAPATSTAGYLTDEYLMLKYLSDFTALSSETSTLPFESKFFPAFAAALNLNCVSRTAKEYAAYLKEYQDAIAELECNLCTPSEDDGRVKPRSLPGYQNLGMGDDDEFPDYSLEY
jgi:hypothetical protein